MSCSGDFLTVYLLADEWKNDPRNIYAKSGGK